MEQNESVVWRAIEQVWNQGDLDRADHFFAAEYVNHGGLIPDLVRGPEAIKISVALLRLAFPDVSIRIDHLTGNRDEVEVGWAAESRSSDASDTTSVRHGPKHLTGTTRSRFADGKIVESWTEWSHAGGRLRLEDVPLQPDA